MQEAIPRIDPALTPPRILGTAELAHCAFGGAGLGALLRLLARQGSGAAALMLDSAAAHELSFRPAQAQLLQAEALARAALFRVASARPPALRLLALLAPGGAMVNTPLDFITRHLDVRLDLLFVRPDQPLPSALPEHDVAFFAASELAPDVLARLAPLFARWPRPALNDPARTARLSRYGVARLLAACPGCRVPDTRALTRAEAAQGLDPVGLGYPALLRPAGSHAGQDLARLDGPADLAAYLAATAGARFYACSFIDYRGADGLYRKYRIAFIAGAPYLCHMAAREHWMVHYLNAGMAESAAKRALEAEAMADFATGFARRHAQALAAIAAALGLDYSQIDCAEAPDGRLLVFEADTAAIIHQMDPPALYPYKAAPMQRAMDAFGAMLRRHAVAPCGAARPAAA